MNGKQTKKLKQIASDLPTAMELVTTPNVKGSTLIGQGTKVTADGKPIVEERLYTAPQPKYVNHLEKLKSIYIKSGWAGVNEYVAEAKLIDKSEVDNSKIVAKVELPEWFNPDDLHDAGDELYYYIKKNAELPQVKESLIANTINAYMGTTGYKMVSCGDSSNKKEYVYTFKK